MTIVDSVNTAALALAVVAAVAADVAWQLQCKCGDAPLAFAHCVGCAVVWVPKL